jgi:hypothetical protein
MNRKQILAMWIGIGVVGGLTLFVPYAMVPGLGVASQSGFEMVTLNIRYASLLASPPGGVTIDWPRVAACEAFVGLVTLGAIFSLGTRRGATA